jgi:hypothetical protein
MNGDVPPSVEIIHGNARRKSGGSPRPEGIFFVAKGRAFRIGSAPVRRLDAAAAIRETER